MNKYLIAGVGGIAFVLGYYIAAQGYSEDIADLKHAYADSARQAQEKNDAKLMELTAKLSETIADRDQKLAALGDAERERADLTGRMLELTAGGSAVSRTDADPCVAIRADLASCRKLVAEGSELRKDGARLLKACAANLDAIRQLR